MEAGQLQLNDITLKEYTLDNLNYLAELKKKLLEAPVEICIERAHYITKYMKSQPETVRQQAPQTYRAGAVSEYLVHKKPVFPDRNLLAGTTGSKAKSAPVYPEFIGLTIWSELETISKRKNNPQLISKKDAEELNLSIYPYWIDRDVLATTKKLYGNIMPVRLLEKMIFYISGKAGCISHTVPSYKRVLQEGMESIIKEAEDRASALEKNKGEKQSIDFYRAVGTVLRGAVVYAKNLAKEARRLAEKEKDEVWKKELLAMAGCLDEVPAKPARTFREAVNCIWLCQVAIHAENINMAMSPGRLDQILYPYYKKDIRNHTLDVKQAMEIIGCFWLKMGDNVDLVPQVSEELFGGAGTAPAVTVGGINEAGEDAVNDLTYIMLRVTELLKLREPNMNARYHYEKNAREYRDRVSQVIGSTLAVPAFHNDVEDIKTLVNQGVSVQDARDYAIIGCVELAVNGKSYDASSSIILNLAAALEMTLYNGKRFTTGKEVFGPKTGEPADFQTFEEFWSAFLTQARWLIEQAIELNEKMAAIHQDMLPTPLLSALFEGPMEKGKDLVFGGAVYNSSGATHVGFADVVDSINAVKKAVFDDAYCTFAELLKAVRADFKGYEVLHQYLLHKTLKYGTSDETKAGVSGKVIRFLYETYQSHMNYRGGKYRPAYWTMTNHAGQGRITYALPNGRHAYQAFASGITPESGVVKSLTECMNSVAALDSLCIPGGEALNIKFTAIKNQKDAVQLGAFVEGYFRSGGQQVQFNIMSHQMLKDAKAHPDKYPGLLVRVSGYSAYFNDLNDTMKDELITRAEYNIEDGRLVETNG